MNLQFDTTMISALISIVVSILSTITFNYFQAKKEQKQKLDDEFNEILKIALEYPYLESIYFTNEWTSKYDKNDEKFLRYEVYCTLVFNFLSKFTKFYQYKEKEIEKYIAVKDWVKLHHKYWNDPTIPDENINTYDQDFVKFVTSCLKEERLQQ